MSESMIVALLSLMGTLIGTIGGILTAGRLTVYRLSELEKKVEKLGNVIDRVYRLERHEAVTREEIEQLRRYHN